MRKLNLKKLQLTPETLTVLGHPELQGVAGGKPVTTRDLPCIPPPP